MRILAYVGKRMLFVVPQLLGISLFTFLLVRLLPGDPAVVMAGTFATEENVARLTHEMGLDKPLYVQYLYYLNDIIHGDLGFAWYTSKPVLYDLKVRFPATLELISTALALSIVLGIPIGVVTALRRGGLADKATFAYGMFAGAVPDFWLGLILIFLLYYRIPAFPAPIGRLDAGIELHRITGLVTVDSLITQNWPALWSGLAHLALPVITLWFVYTPGIVKMTRSAMEEMLTSRFVNYARASGLPRMQVMRYALRNSMPPAVTMIGQTYAYLLGGAVLVERVFSWGGLGSYAVTSIENSDFAAIQGFVLVAAMFTLGVWLAVDLVYFAINPTIRY